MEEINPDYVKNLALAYNGWCEGGQSGLEVLNCQLEAEQAGFSKKFLKKVYLAVDFIQAGWREYEK